MRPGLLSPISIRQRLSLFISLLLLSVILIFGWISYVGVKRAALQVGRDRVQNLTEQLSSMFATGVPDTASSLYTAANKPVFKKYLLSNGKDSAKEVLHALNELVTDSLNFQADLLNANRVLLLTTLKKRMQFKLNPDSVLKGNATNHPDSAGLGKLYALKDSIFFPTIAPIVEKNKVIGYLIRWKKSNASPKALEQFSQLMGTDAKIYIGNNDGSLWTDLSKQVPPPPIVKQNYNEINEYTRSGNNRVLATIRPIANTNWLLLVELSKKRIIEAANRFLYWLIIAAAVLLIIGILATWKISKSISEPIRKLTAASSAIAGGDYSSPVLINRYDELGNLARTFNAMSVQVQNSQMELEKKAYQYKLLFESNPMPMWIISDSSFQILDVNDAAINHYGFSREEFLRMKATDLKPEEDREKFSEQVNNPEQGKKSGIWRHKKKDGKVMMVEVIVDDIQYQDKPLKIILANDVTEKLKAEEELANQRISQQKIITETAIQAQEKEREEIGKELHDNINQMLAAAKLYLEIAQESSQEIIRDPLFKSYETIKMAMIEIRHLSKQLVPPPLNTSLVETIKALTEDIQAFTPIEISFTFESFDETDLTASIKLMIYRIVQEQFHNILKHSGANKVKINVSSDNNNIHLEIEDNGVGFNVRKKSKGIGLRNIDNRVKFYNGSANFISEVGKGCRLEILIPLEKQGKIVTRELD